MGGVKATSNEVYVKVLKVDKRIGSISDTNIEISDTNGFNIDLFYELYGMISNQNVIDVFLEDNTGVKTLIGTSTPDIESIDQEGVIACSVPAGLVTGRYEITMEVTKPYCPTKYDYHRISIDITNTADGDGIPIATDNCPDIPNADQNNSDADALGDVCDNCLFVSNVDQTDSDGDNVGDTCDNCLSISNADQVGTDGDNVGDPCDNCSAITNSDQADNDNDTLGDVCDLDDDNDGMPDIWELQHELDPFDSSDSDLDPDDDGLLSSALFGIRSGCIF